MKKRAFIITVAFVLLVAVIAERSLHSVRKETQNLKQKLAELQAEKSKEEATFKMLSQQVESQSDPAWIEMVLARELNLLPEGHRFLQWTKR